MRITSIKRAHQALFAWAVVLACGYSAADPRSDTGDKVRPLDKALIERGYRADRSTGTSITIKRGGKPLPGDLRKICAERQVETLRFADVAIPDGYFEGLDSCRGALELVSFQVVKMNSAELFRQLASLPGLKILEVYSSGVTDRDLEGLEQLPGLTSVGLPANPDVTSVGVQKLLDSCPDLEGLNVARTGVDSSILPSLLKRSRLKGVTLILTRIKRSELIAFGTEYSRLYGRYILGNINEDMVPGQSHGK